MYQIVKCLPEEEKFGLAGQIRRAAVSLTNNIAEGHGRFYFQEQIKFTLNSRGSLEELLDDLNTCEDEQYLPLMEIEELRADGWHIHKLTNDYIRYLRGRVTSNSARVKESSPGLNLEDDLKNLLPCFNPSTL